MTWDTKRLGKPAPDETKNPPIIDQAVTDDANDLPVIPSYIVTQRALQDGGADLPADPAQRQVYAQYGLIHPDDLPMITQIMTRGIPAVHGHQYEPWPVDMAGHEV